MFIELGTKVLCEGYIKRNNNYIDNSLEHQKYLCKQNNREFEPSESGFYDSCGNGVDWEQLIPVKDFIANEFTGFICGRKKLHTAIYPTVIYVGPYLDEQTVVYKDKYIDCYEVCVENKNKSWGKRYVPIDKVEILIK